MVKKLRNLKAVFSVLLFAFLVSQFILFRYSFVPTAKAQTENPLTIYQNVNGDYYFKTLDNETVWLTPLPKLEKWYGKSYSTLNISQFTNIIGSKFIVFNGTENKLHIQLKFLGTLYAELILYPLNISEYGALEFEIVVYKSVVFTLLNNTLVFPFPLYNLTAYYQPPLYEEYGFTQPFSNTTFSVNATHVMKLVNGSWRTIGYRPENVVGSYAVYHPSKRNNEYKAGKAFHIYRPKAVDSAGNTTWCDLNITNSILTVTISQEFLNSAVYPVTIDPLFGYTTAGASATEAYEGLAGSLYTITENGYAQYINVSMSYTHGDDTWYKAKAAIYKDSDSTKVVESSVLSTQTSFAKQWIKFTVTSTALTANTGYELVEGYDSDGTTQTSYIYYDTDNTVTYVAASITDLTFPSPVTWNIAKTTGRAYSVYVTYTTNAAPTIGEFQAPATVYANKYFLLNATINDADGIAQFVNATIEINGTIILKWDATNEFSKYSDANNYCTLDAANSIKTNLNTTAHKLSFKIKLGWNYTEGNISVSVTNTKCFDNQGASGSNSYANLFYFEDDLIVYSASVNDNRINPSQSITFSGKLYYQGTTTPPEDVSGITAKVDLGTTNKGSNTTIGSDGSFSISFPGEGTVGSYSYTVYCVTVRNSVQNQTVSVIFDRDKMDSFAYSGGTLANMTFRLLSEYYSNTLNNTNLTLNVYLNDSLLDSISATSNNTGLVFVSLTHNIYDNGTLTFNLTDGDGIVSYSYSCPVEVYVESLEVFSIDPVALYTGDSLTITMDYKSKANINGTYITLSNVYWKALIYTDKYYGYYNFNLYNGSFANTLESRVELMPIALSEGSYMLNMTFYIKGSDTFLGSATSPYFVVKSRPATSGGAPSTVVKLPLTVVVRDYKGGYAQGVYVVVIDQYNATVWEGTTDNWGTAMTTLNPGTYNVTIKYDSETLSDTVTLSNEPITKEFTLPGLAITPVTVTLDTYSILWLGIGLIGAVGAVILERKEKTAFAVALGLVTIGAVLHSLLVITHQMPPYFTVPPFNFSSLTTLPSFSLPSFSLPQLSLDMQTITFTAVGITVPVVVAYVISQRGGTHKRRVRVGKFGEERRKRVWK